MCKSSRCRLVVSWVILWVLVSPLVGQEAAQDKIDLHLIAPDARNQGRHDPLIVEASMHLLAWRLAHEYGLRTKLWFADTPEKIPDSAVPRLHWRYGRATKFEWITFTYKDRELSVHVGSGPNDRRLMLRLDPVRRPEGMEVGVIGYVYGKGGQQTDGQIRDLTLNGEPFRPDKTFTQGRPPKAHQVQWQGDVCKLRLFAGDSKANSESHFYVTAPVEGNFVLSGQVKTPKSNRRAGSQAHTVNGLVVKLDDEGSGFSLGRSNRWIVDGDFICEKGDKHFGISPDSFANLNVHFDDKGQDKPPHLTGSIVSCVNWRELTGSIRDLTDKALDRLGKKMDLPAPAKPHPGRLSQADRERLAAARRRALEFMPAPALEAAATFDRLLAENPRCPGLMRASAMPISMLVCQDPLGWDSRRTRPLARALARALAAERLDQGPEQHSRLDVAWLQLACGYPEAAMETISAVTDEEDVNDEKVPLRLFVMRNPDLLAPPEGDKPRALLMGAWLLAVEQTRRDGLMEQWSGRTAAGLRSAAFLPEKAYTVSMGHQLSELGIRLALARSSFDLLTCDRLDEDSRRKIGQELLKATGGHQADDMRGIARGVAWSAMEAEIQLPETIQGVCKLYKAAQQAAPAGCTVAAGHPAPVLSVGEWAAMQRGLLLKTVSFKLTHYYDKWGVPESAARFAGQMSEAFEDLPWEQAYFHTCAQAYAGKSGATKGAADKLLKLYKHPEMHRHLLILGRDHELLDDRSRSRLLGEFPHGRGGWALALGVQAAGETSNYWPRHSLALRCVTTDKWSGAGWRTVVWWHRDFNLYPGLARTMGYNTRVLSVLASAAEEGDDYAAVERICKQMMQIDPNDETPHRKLIRLARQREQPQRMARLCREMVEKCDYSVCVSNTLGKAAEWFARNGHPAEAMEFGRIGARSYSFAGLVGLAEALAVNGEYEEAKRVFEAVTKRYRYSGDDRVGFLLHYGTTPEEVAQVTREIMRTRPDIADQEAQRATGAILAHAPDKTYYEALGEDILGEIKPLRRQILEAMFAMQQRRFEDVLTFTKRLLDDKKDTYDPDARMLRLHALRLLGRDADAREHATTMLAEATGAKPMVEYVLGRIDAETFKTRSTGLEPTNHYHFTMGVEAELAGRMDQARSHYAQADTARWQGEVMQYWARQMARETQAEGKAAEPAPTE